MKKRFIIIFALFLASCSEDPNEAAFISMCTHNENSEETCECSYRFISESFSDEELSTFISLNEGAIDPTEVATDVKNAIGQKMNRLLEDLKVCGMR